MTNLTNCGPEQTTQLAEAIRQAVDTANNPVHAQCNVLGVLLRYFRAWNRLSATDMAAQTGLTRSFISQLERGKVLNTTLDTHHRVLACMGLRAYIEFRPAQGALPTHPAQDN
jgi:DNA-binding XRE family transcriptional regulator